MLIKKLKERHRKDGRWRRDKKREKWCTHFFDVINKDFVEKSFIAVLKG